MATPKSTSHKTTKRKHMPPEVTRTDVRRSESDVCSESDSYSSEGITYRDRNLVSLDMSDFSDDPDFDRPVGGSQHEVSHLMCDNRRRWWVRWQTRSNRKRKLQPIDEDDLTGIHTKLYKFCTQRPGIVVEAVGAHDAEDFRPPPSFFALPEYEISRIDMSLHFSKGTDCAFTALCNALSRDLCDSLWEHYSYIDWSWQSFTFVAQSINRIPCLWSWKHSVVLAQVMPRLWGQTFVGTYLVGTTHGHCYTVRFAERVVVDAAEEAPVVFRLPPDIHSLEEVIAALSPCWGGPRHVVEPRISRRTAHSRQRRARRERKRLGPLPPREPDDMDLSFF